MLRTVGAAAATRAAIPLLHHLRRSYATKLPDIDVSGSSFVSSAPCPSLRFFFWIGDHAGVGSILGPITVVFLRRGYGLDVT